MSKLILLLACLASLAAAGILDRDYRLGSGALSVQRKGVDRLNTLSKDELLKQKFILDVLHQVNLPLENVELLNLLQQSSIDENMFVGKLDEDMLYVLNLLHTDRMLSRNGICSINDIEHVRQLIGLYRLMVSCRDFQELKRLVVYVRKNINSELFVKAFIMALQDRRDTQMLIIPSLHEILPQIFYDDDLIREVQNLGQNQLTLRTGLFDLIGLGRLLHKQQDLNQLRGGRTGGLIDRSQLWMPWREMHQQMRINKILGGRQQTSLKGSVDEVIFDITNHLRNDCEECGEQKTLGLLSDDIGLRSFIDILVDELIVKQKAIDNGILNDELLDGRLDRDYDTEIRQQIGSVDSEIGDRTIDINNDRLLHVNRRRLQDTLGRGLNTDNDQLLGNVGKLDKSGINRIQEVDEQRLDRDDMVQGGLGIRGVNKLDDYRTKNINNNDILQGALGINRGEGYKTTDINSDRLLYVNRRRLQDDILGGNVNRDRDNLYNKKITDYDVFDDKSSGERLDRDDISKVRGGDNFRDIDNGVDSLNRIQGGDLDEDVQRITSGINNDRLLHVNRRRFQDIIGRDEFIGRRNNIAQTNLRKPIDSYLNRIQDDIPDRQLDRDDITQGGLGVGGVNRGVYGDAKTTDINNDRLVHINRRRLQDDDVLSGDLNRDSIGYLDDLGLKQKLGYNFGRRADFIGDNLDTSRLNVVDRSRKQLGGNEYNRGDLFDDEDDALISGGRRISKDRESKRGDDRKSKYRKNEDKAEEEDGLYKNGKDFIRQEDEYKYLTGQQRGLLNRQLYGGISDDQQQGLYKNRKDVFDQEDIYKYLTGPQRGLLNRQLYGGKSDDTLGLYKNRKDIFRQEDDNKFVTGQERGLLNRQLYGGTSDEDQGFYKSRKDIFSQGDDLKYGTGLQSSRVGNPLLDRFVGRGGINNLPVTDINDDRLLHVSRRRLQELENNKADDIGIGSTNIYRNRDIDAERYNYFNEKQNFNDFDYDSLRNRRLFGYDDTSRDQYFNRQQKRIYDDDDDVDVDDDLRISRRFRRSLDEDSVIDRDVLLKGTIRGDVLLQYIQQFVARLNIERIALGQVNDLKQIDTLQYRNNERLITNPGERLALRLNAMNIGNKFNRMGLQKINEIINNFESVLQQRIQKVRNTSDDLRSVLKEIGGVLLGKVRGVGLIDILRNAIIGSDRGVQIGQTERLCNMLNDRMIHLLLKRIVDIIDGQIQLLPRQNINDDIGVNINSINVDKLRTFVEYTETDLTNMLNTRLNTDLKNRKSVLGRVARLNHKDFKLNLDITSDRQQQVIMRTFIGPKLDVADFNEQRKNFILLDLTTVDLKQGRNLIVRNSKDITWTGRDTTPLTVIYERVMRAIQGNIDFTRQTLADQSNLFPHRLLLPRGRIDGLAMQMLVVLTPIDDVTSNRLMVIDKLVGLDSLLLDRLPLNYPLDRGVNINDFLQRKNILLKDVILYHDDQIKANIQRVF